MKKINKSKVIIPALAMIALTTAASATGTVAWFAANTTVNVTGMTMTATAGSNLLIAGDTIGSKAKIATSSTGWGNSLTQSDASNIAPVSTVNGTAFYYTDQAIANGDAQSGITFSTLEVDTDSGDYRKTTTPSTYGFLEYVFQLQATNSNTSAAKYIDLTDLTLSYTAATADLNTKASAIHAYRAAVFVEDISSGAPAGGVGTLNAIYAQTGYSHFTTVEGQVQAVSATNGTTAAVTYASAASSLATVAAGATTQYKVVVRAYLEGEDVTCYNDGFIGITAGWSLRVGLTLNSTAKTGAVSAIATTVTTRA